MIRSNCATNKIIVLGNSLVVSRLDATQLVYSYSIIMFAISHMVSSLKLNNVVLGWYVDG